MNIRLLETQLVLRNSSTRIPFRYGKACLTRCPQAVLQVTIESHGNVQHGYSGDCLPPGWFDKRPGKGFEQQLADMLSVIQFARQAFLDELQSETAFFSAWLAADDRVHRFAIENGQTDLLASFGVSLVERALIDAICRSAECRFFDAVRSNLLGVDPGRLHGELSGLNFSDWLPRQPESSIFVRHTVGLGDPLTAADIRADERLSDARPQALEEYVRQTGTRYFKVKVANNLEADIERLKTIASLIERARGDDYALTMDGNEQYGDASEFDALIEAISSTPELQTLWRRTLVIEQPLDRSIALDPRHTAGVRALGRHKPVIIDESDGSQHAFERALEVGYRGVSSKNCKGTLRSLLNAGLVWLRNDRGTRSEFVMTGEDLCCVGVVSVQSDLCLVAALGLKHVERNGHHYHPGLSWLPERQRESALSAHGDLYARHGNLVVPNVVDGQFQIGSLQCAGFGFSPLPDLADFTPAEEWEYASLGLSE